MTIDEFSRGNYPTARASTMATLPDVSIISPAICQTIEHCVYLFIINDLFQCPQWWTTHTCALECLVRTTNYIQLDRMRARFSIDCTVKLGVVLWFFRSSPPVWNHLHTAHTKRERKSHSFQSRLLPIYKFDCCLY